MLLGKTDLAIMYIKLYRAIEAEAEESCDLVQAIVNIIEDNLEFYEISKYNYVEEGGSPEDAIEYYIDQFSKKYLKLDNIWDSYYWNRTIYIPWSAGKQENVRNILANIKTKYEVHKFLNWQKEKWTGMVCHFEYQIINTNEISDVIQNSNCTEYQIELSDWNTGNYNPIITWENHQDISTLYIMDWAHFKYNLVHNMWFDYVNDYDDFIDNFNNLTTLEEYLDEHCSELHKEVRLALEHEVNEFYNIFKDDIYIEDDTAWSKDHKMMLVDAIWNYAPLFSNTTIEHYVMKLYNKEIKL